MSSVELVRATLQELDGERFVELVERYSPTSERENDPTKEQESTEQKKQPPQAWTLSKILSTDFPEPVWVIPNMIPAGLTILAGSPKIGKSWMALSLGLALTMGGRALGKIQVDKAKACYLALEDTPQRIKDRALSLDAELTDDMTFFFEWERGLAGVAQLGVWLEANPGVKLVIVDTLQKFRTPSRAGSNIYESDYEAVSCLKQVADKHNVAVLVIHHIRKGGASDQLEAVSGSFGITGSADTVVTLTRARGQADAKLFITGRDVEEQELALRMDPFVGWSLLGDAKEYEMTKERREILDVYEQSAEPLGAKDVANVLGKPAGSIRYLIHVLAKEELLINVSYGKYTISPNTTNTANTTNSANSANTSKSVSGTQGGTNTSLTLFEGRHL